METVELVILTGGPRHGTPSVGDPFVGVELPDRVESDRIDGR